MGSLPSIEIKACATNLNHPAAETMLISHPEAPSVLLDEIAAKEDTFFLKHSTNVVVNMTTHMRIYITVCHGKNEGRPSQAALF